MRLFGTVIAWALSSLVAYALGSIASTQVMLAGVERVGREVAFADNWRTTLADLMGFWQYGVVIALGFLVAFFVANLVKAVLPSLSRVAYPVAGAAAVAAALALMEANYGIIPVLGAQESLGYWLQLGAGAVGGFVFEVIRPKARDEVAARR